MTACKNFAKGGKAGRVITAALVATLSVGAPVVALATTGAEGGIDMLATTEENVKQATVTYDGADGTKFVYNEKEQGLVPTSLTLGNGKVVDDLELSPAANEREADKYYYFYVSLDGTNGVANFDQYAEVSYKDGDAQQTLTNAAKLVGTNNASGYLSYETPTKIGSYAVIVAYSTQAGGNNATLNYVGTAYTFSITSQSLAGATIWDMSDDNKDVTDTTFNYVSDQTGDLNKVSGVLANVGVAVDGIALDKEDYDLSLVLQGGTGAKMDVDDPVAVGTDYYVQIEGKKAYDGQVVRRAFKLEKLDLAKAELDVAKYVESFGDHENDLNGLVYTINGVLPNMSDFTLELVGNPDNEKLFNDKKGEYTFRISPRPGDEDTDVTGSKLFTVNLVSDAVDIKYDGNTPDAITVNLSAEKPSYFDADKVTVEDASDGTKIPSSAISIAYTNKDGEAVSAEDLKTTPGEYKVTITVNYKTNAGNLYANEATIDVTVLSAQLTDEANVFFSYDGDNVPESASDVYDGTDLSEKFAILVKNDTKTFVEGTDYSVEITKTVDGKDVAVDEVVDAGDYKISVKPITFTVDGEDDPVVFNFNVNQAVICDIDFNEPLVDEHYKTKYFAYTGDVIEPMITFFTGHNTETGEHESIYVPADSYEIKYFEASYNEEGHLEYDTDKPVEFKEAGLYAAVVSATDENVNFNFGSVNHVYAVTISDANIYTDVSVNDWFAQSVLDATNLRLMRGISGTDTFAPYAEMNRAQVAIVLFRMAGLDNRTWSGDSTAPAFSDVSDEHYAYTEINWAKTVGVVNGNPDGTFAPDTSVSRQQFAIMLANYAKMAGKYEAVDTEAVLADFTDGDAVEDYARESVAWAIAHGIMGQNVVIDPLGTLDRAQGATMIVRFADFIDYTAGPAANEPIEWL